MANVRSLETFRPLLRILQSLKQPRNTIRRNICCARPSTTKRGRCLAVSHQIISHQSRPYTTDTDSQENETGATSEETQYEYDIRQRILAASLIHVQEFGWTQKALEAGAQDEGLPPVAHGMFPRGGGDLVHFFYSKCNRELAEILAAEVEQAKTEGRTIKTTQFIREAVETRLRMLFPYMDSWHQAMAIQTLPQNSVDSFSNTVNLMDEIWFYAGDRSTDFNWYTKRMSLYGVYKATEIYMLQDNSIDKADTWLFLDNRLSDLRKLGECKRSCDQNSDVFKEAAKGLAIMGRNMLGFSSRDR